MLSSKTIPLASTLPVYMSIPYVFGRDMRVHSPSPNLNALWIRQSRCRGLSYVLDTRENIKLQVWGRGRGRR